MIIRKIEQADLVACGELFANVFSAPPWSESWSADIAHRRLLHFYESDRFVGLLAENTSSLLGFTLGNAEPYFDGMYFYIREMCTAPAWQSQGIGGQLLDELNTVLVSMQVSRAYLATGKNMAAARFYQSNGFQYNDTIGFYAKGIAAKQN